MWVAALAAHATYAQESIHYASVSGRVTDQSGSVVAGAQVTANKTETNLTSTQLTDREGRFRFPYLTVEAAGIRSGHALTDSITRCGV